MTGPVSAAEVKARPVRWLWRDRIPKGAITFVAGRPDQSKGLFVTHVAADVSRRGGKVLYSAAEDSDELMTKPRLEAAGANLDNVELWQFALPTQQSELEAIVREEGIALVVIDPLAAHLHGSVSRTSDSIRLVTNPLKAMCGRTNAAVLVVDHALKRVSRDAHPMTAIGGSGSGFPAACRMGYAFGSDPADADRRVLACVKSNLRERPKSVVFEIDVDELPVVGEIPSLVVVDDDVEFDARRLLSSSIESSGKTGRRPDRRAAAAEWLTNYLASAGKPVKVGEVMEDAKQHGMTVRTLKRAAADMGIEKSGGGGRSALWDLPSKVKQVMGLEEEDEQEEAGDE